MALFGVMASGSLLAHHSLAGVYDMKKEAELSGHVDEPEVRESPWVADLAVKNADGSTVDWIFSTRVRDHPGARGISKRGPNALRSGDKV